MAAWYSVREGIDFSRNPFAFLEKRESLGTALSHFRAGPMKISLVFDAQAIEQVLVKNAAHYDKGPVLGRLHEFFGSGLLTAEGATWKKHRQTMNPAFQRDRIGAYAALIESAAALALAPRTAGSPPSTTPFLAREVLGESSPLSENLASPPTLDVTAFALDTMLRIAQQVFFGLTTAEPRPEIARSFDEVGRYFEYLLSPAGQVLGRIPSPRRFRYLRAVKDLDAILLEILAQRLQRADSRTDLPANPDVLSLLVNAIRQETLTLSEVRDEMMTLFFAGHETSAMALAFCMELLVRHPEWAERCRASSSAGSDEATQAAATESADAMLEQVIQEALRLYPPVWSVARRVVEPNNVAGEDLPRNSIVVIPTWAIHRSVRYFDHPHEFRPERWEKSKRSALPRAAYIPFGFGPRMCIGSTLAMLELKLILKAWLAQGEWRVVPGVSSLALGTAVERANIAVQGGLTLRPKASLQISLAR